MAASSNGNHAGVVIVAENATIRRRMADAIEPAAVTIEAKARSVEVVAEHCAGSPQSVLVLQAGPSAAATAIRDLKRVAPETRIVLVADHSEESNGPVLRAGLKAKVEALVYLDEIAQALWPTVLAVFADQIVFPRRERRRVDIPVLSHRERQVLRLAVDGRSNDEIGAMLFLATSTVKSHLTSAFAKLAVRSRSEAAALILNPDEPAGRAILAGAIDDPEVLSWR